MKQTMHMQNERERIRQERAYYYSLSNDERKSYMKKYREILEGNDKYALFADIFTWGISIFLFLIAIIGSFMK